MSLERRSFPVATAEGGACIPHHLNDLTIGVRATFQHGLAFMAAFGQLRWNPRFVDIVLALCFATCSIHPSLHAQVLYGSLTGNIADASNAPLPGAKIAVANVETGITTQYVTDIRGVYLASDLQPGVYRVTISAQGFATVVQENVRVDANSERRVDISLRLAQVNEQITVNAAAEALQTDRSDVRSQLASTQISALPMGIDRNFQTLFVLVPGVQPPYPSHSFAGNPTGSLAMNVSGQGESTNSTMIDGVPDPNYWEENILAYVPPAEAIESVNIVTSGFDAEQGGATGLVANVVIKSGTNALHGAAWEYNTISALQARNFFYYGATNPKNILNQFGLALGGPFIKNKLFFFGDWERYRLSQNANSIQSVPTLDIREGNFSATGTTIYNPLTGNADGTGRVPFPGNVIPSALINSAAAKMAALIPAPNYGSGIADNYFGSGDLRLHRDSVDLKINYYPSNKSTIFGRYSAEPTFVFDPQVLGAAGGDAVGPTSQPGNAYGLTQSVGMGATYTFTPHLLFDVNVGFTRQRLAAQNTDINKNYGSDVLGIPGTNGTNPLQGGYPIFYLAGLADLGNPSPYNPFLFRDNEYLVGANLSWVKSSHTFRFGFSLTRPQINHFQPQTDWGPRGGFEFDGTLTALNGGSAPNAYNSWADFLLGLPDLMGKDYQFLNPDTARIITYAFYARDTWQVTRKLSVNYGVRYEAYPYPTHDHYGGVNYDPTTNLAYVGGVGQVPSNVYMDLGLGQLAPRVGLAYRVNEKTVVRTGFGINTDSETWLDTINFYPATISQQLVGANSYAAAGSLAAGIPAFPPPDLSTGKTPLPTYIGTDAYAMKFHRGYLETYNFTMQRDIGKGFNAQVAYVGNHGVRLEAVQNINAAGPGEGIAGAPLFKLWGNPNGIGLNTPFNGGRYNALQSQLTRRVAGVQLGVVYTFSKAIDYTDAEYNGLRWNWGPMLSANKALAGFDRTHNFQLWSVLDSPFGHGKQWVAQGVGATILGGWTLSPLLSRESGTPFTIGSSGASLDAPGNSQDADQVLPRVKILGGHGPGSPYFDPYAFAPVTAVRFGTSGRNIVRGPGVFILNVSLARDFNITERFKVQFRAEAYSLTNTPNFGNPGTTVSDASFVNGQITDYGGYDTIRSSTGQRQLRFALKLLF
jgi:hypothetical protein